MSPVIRAQALLEAVWPLVSVVAWFLFMSNAEHVGRTGHDLNKTQSYINGVLR